MNGGLSWPSEILACSYCSSCPKWPLGWPGATTLFFLFHSGAVFFLYWGQQEKERRVDDIDSSGDNNNWVAEPRHVFFRLRFLTTNRHFVSSFPFFSCENSKIISDSIFNSNCLSTRDSIVVRTGFFLLTILRWLSWSITMIVFLHSSRSGFLSFVLASFSHAAISPVF